MKINHLLGGVLAIFCFTSVAAQAQTARPGHVAPKPRVVVAKADGMKDGLTMQKGRVMVTETGITNPLAADKKLLNGTTISPSGLVTAPGGTTTQMAEGDQVSLTGKITTRQAIMEADSIAKIQAYDLKYPGKRKKAEAERERRDKAEAKLKEKREKALAKKEK
ncbi:DUF6799 domain-containing protein [Hymenobacter rubidus]|uniref:DUF6799 domain-containing protein n=1 Tax=Hymenobacter rubidus TaxID=1441626 RepID=UPI00191DF30C|nr:DUF6799 domain-containing protein [Hymenobacter rubidus]